MRLRPSWSGAQSPRLWKQAGRALPRAPGQARKRAASPWTKDVRGVAGSRTFRGSSRPLLTVHPGCRARQSRFQAIHFVARLPTSVALRRRRARLRGRGSAPAPEHLLPFCYRTTADRRRAFDGSSSRVGVRKKPPEVHQGPRAGPPTVSAPEQPETEVRSPARSIYARRSPIGERSGADATRPAPPRDVWRGRVCGP